MKRNRPDPVSTILQQPDWVTQFANLRAFNQRLNAARERGEVLVEEEERPDEGDRSTS